MEDRTEETRPGDLLKVSETGTPSHTPPGGAPSGSVMEHGVHRPCEHTEMYPSLLQGDLRLPPASR